MDHDIDGATLERLRRDIAAGGDLMWFYFSAAWKHKREKIMRQDHRECVLCRGQGRYRRGEIVHHVNHVRDAPEMALDETYIDADGQERRQLITVCRDCHETVCHPERMHVNARTHYTTPERWD